MSKQASEKKPRPEYTNVKITKPVFDSIKEYHAAKYPLAKLLVFAETLLLLGLEEMKKNPEKHEKKLFKR